MVLLLTAHCVADMRTGAVVRGPLDQKRIAFVFTGHTYAEGGEVILNELARHHGKGSFFLTGDFLVNPDFGLLIRRIVAEGHYLGPHSDKHLMFCATDGAREILVSREQFRADLSANLEKIERFGVKREDIRFFLPAYEQCNPTLANWSEEMGLTLINYSAGTRSNADYTGEGDKNFVSSEKIYEGIVRRERDDSHGLNGFILLLHIGSGSGRRDKFTSRFGELLDYLSARGYEFVRVDELLDSKSTR